MKKEKPFFKRILLKLSGEALLGEQAYGLDFKVIHSLADEIREIKNAGMQIAIVVGGGNIWRGNIGEKFGMDRGTADYMGMLATVMNSLAIQSVMEKMEISSRVMSALTLNQIAEPYIRAKAIEHLNKGRVIILAGGTGLPFFTTDTTAALRAIEIKADVLLKATKVDAVYSNDPQRDKGAFPYREITYTEFLSKNLKAIDSTAISLCREYKLPIILFNMKVEGNIKKVCLEGRVGTIIKED